MITEIQRKYLDKLLKGEVRREDDPKRFSHMMIAIQKQIDKNISNTIWMLENRKDVLLDEKSEIDNEDIERYRRFKAFAFICTKLNPETAFEDFDLKEALKHLSLLYPKYYFQAVHKKYRDKEDEKG